LKKKRVVAKARKAGLKTGEFMRLAASNYQPNEDELALSNMIDQMNLVTANTSKVIDKALASIAASNKRITKMEAQSGRNK